MARPEVVLKKGREKSVLRRHPWIFSGAVARVEGQPQGGAVVDVRDSGGNWLARGLINQESQIVVRLLTWEDEPLDGAFWRRRLERALAGRKSLENNSTTDAYRLVHAESDGLPGLTVDRYGAHLVVQFLALGAEARREELLAALAELCEPHSIYERSDVDVRQKEGLKQRVGLAWGSEPAEQVEIVENGHRFLVDLRAGQKTGFYLDQRENRALLPPFCAGKEVLDGFSYSGAFSIYAASAPAAHVTLVDSSGGALEMGRLNLALAGVDARACELVEGDVFGVLRGYRAQERHFDVVVLDPPKLAPTARSVKRASRAYKDVNLLAFQLLRPGGVLFTSSCSGLVSADLFQKIVFGAALDAGREAQIIGYLSQAADHPVALTFPEGTYLKGLICRVW
jgi:23S rRNA (cytosine1962-C5)-methyltransferase